MSCNKTCYFCKNNLFRVKYRDSLEVSWCNSCQIKWIQNIPIYPKCTYCCIINKKTTYYENLQKNFCEDCYQDFCEDSYKEHLRNEEYERNEEWCLDRKLGILYDSDY